MPQWDFLDFVTRHAAGYPGVPAADGDRGDRAARRAGAGHRADRRRRGVPATLTVAADGRRSTVRRAARLPVRAYDAPMDVLWFRLSRRGSDVASTGGRVAPGRVLIRIDRGDYWQVGYVIDKGGYDRLRAAGLDAFRTDLATLEPALADRVDELVSWTDVSVLEVKVDRLRRWHRPGLLCIGDAAHAMSPVGGVGINLAVQDAVATANLLVRPLWTGALSERDLARVQRRRALPTAVTQAGQRAIHRRIVAPLLDGGAAPAPVRVLQRFPALQAIPAYLLAIGIRPEHLRRQPRCAASHGPVTLFGSGGDVARCAAGDDPAAGRTTARPDVDDVVGRGQQVQVVVDHDDRRAVFEQPVEDADQRADVHRVQARRRLVEHIEGVALAGAQAGRDAQPLRLAAGQRRRRLAQPQVAETDVEDRPQRARDRRHVPEPVAGPPAPSGRARRRS